MDLKLLLPLLALVAFSSAAPASQNQVTHLSEYYNFLQYLMPIVPSDEFLFKHGLKLASLGRCGAGQRAYCQGEFAKALGKTIDIFTDPIQFAELIASYYKLPVTGGILKLCKAQVEFRNCFGIFYASCTDAFNIYQDEIKNDLNKAFILAGVYDDIEFDCGGGLTQGLENWKCITTVNGKSGFGDTIKACFDAYNNTITKDPRPEVYCPAGSTLSLCIAQGYKTLDGCANEAVQWWACERASRRTRLEGFCDHNPCAAIFPKQPTISPTSSEDFIEFVNSGGLISEAQHKFFKLASLTREQRLVALAKMEQQ